MRIDTADVEGQVWTLASPANSLIQTPLHYAIEAGQADLMKILIRSGANVDLVDNNGMSPLHLAVRLQQRAIVKVTRCMSRVTRQILVDENADVNVVDSKLLTPCMWACHLGDAVSLAHLVRHPLGDSRRQCS